MVEAVSRIELGARYSRSKVLSCGSRSQKGSVSVVDGRRGVTGGP